MPNIVSDIFAELGVIPEDVDGFYLKPVVALNYPEHCSQLPLERFNPLITNGFQEIHQISKLVINDPM